MSCAHEQNKSRGGHAWLELVKSPEKTRTHAHMCPSSRSLSSHGFGQATHHLQNKATGEVVPQDDVRRLSPESTHPDTFGIRGKGKSTHARPGVIMINPSPCSWTTYDRWNRSRLGLLRSRSPSLRWSSPTFSEHGHSRC